MEISFRKQLPFVTRKFKIDLIVWKLVLVSPEEIMEDRFKIDLIVWKYKNGIRGIIMIVSLKQT